MGNSPAPEKCAPRKYQAKGSKTSKAQNITFCLKRSRREQTAPKKKKKRKDKKTKQNKKRRTNQKNEKYTPGK